MVSEVAAILNKHCRPQSPAQSRSGVPPLAPVTSTLRKSAVRSTVPPLAPGADAIKPTFTLPVAFSAPTVIPQGDGSVKVLPGKPVQWLTSKQVATHFGLSQSTIYRCIEDGTLPPEMVQKPGKRKLRINAAALAHLETTWRARRDAA